MALSSLIDGQTIQIDNHNRGTIHEWDNTIHLHKRMNREKYRGAQVIIPIAEDGELKFIGVGCKRNIDTKIKNEIEKAFTNPTIRTEFVKTLLKSLSNFNSPLKIKR